MYYLIIAKDYECNIYDVIMSGTYDEISKYTTKFFSSGDIRSKNKDIVDNFVKKYNDNGDIVIINSCKPNVRVRVLYKQDIEVVNVIIKSQNFLIKLLKSKRMNNFSEWDYRMICYSQNNEYKKHIKKWLNSRKKYGDYYLSIYNIEKYYDYLTAYGFPKRSEIYSDIKRNKEKKIKRISKQKLENNSLFNEIYDLYLNEGIDGVFNVYSIDYLVQNLSNDEFKVLGLRGYK